MQELWTISYASGTHGAARKVETELRVCGGATAEKTERLLEVVARQEKVDSA